jgi:hypothetical protein
MTKMEIDQYLREWNEACAYAYECFPPFVYEIDLEFVETFAFILIVIYSVYRFNENRIQRRNRNDL